MANPLTPVPVGAPDREESPRLRGPVRPSLLVVGLVFTLFKGVREFLAEVLSARYGFWGGLIPTAALVVVIVGWRVTVRRRRKVDYTPEEVREQIARSGLRPPAFTEDGTLLGSSVLAVNQRPKILEVITEYTIHGYDGTPRGAIRQVDQSRGKRLARILTAFDQFFTHRFELRDPDGEVVLRITRPRKIFKSRVEVHDAAGRLVGRIRQENIFFKIRFGIENAEGWTIGRIRAENWRAWDFAIETPLDGEVARVVKSWEGFTRALFTRADLYVVRVHRRLDEPLRTMVLVAAVTIDLALKQDPQGFGG